MEHQPLAVTTSLEEQDPHRQPAEVQLKKKKNRKPPSMQFLCIGAFLNHLLRFTGLTMVFF